MKEPSGHRRNAHASASVHVVASAEERARAFRQARRHTWFVRLMRLVLPVVAIVAMSSYGVLFFAASQLKGKGIETGSVRIDPKNLTMQAPRYNGFGKDGSHYVVRARDAITDLKQSAPVRLNQISGEITQQSGVITYLKAVWGTYDQKKDVLELYEKIDIDGSTGMKARLTRATVLPKESRVISQEPVYAENDTANIRSDRMTLNSKARQATFIDRVHVKLKSNQPAKKTADGETKAAAAKSPAPLGLAANSGQPIEVKSEQLDVDDNAKTALFRRDVFAKQGDATLQAPELDVLYEGKANLGTGPAAAKEGQSPAPAEQQSKLKTIKARGGVQMANKDDHATADTLDYDAATEQAVLNGNVVMTSLNDRRAVASKVEVDQKADTILLTGDVLVTQGKNTMKGRRLFVDRKTGTTRLETPSEGWQLPGRIQTVFYQNEQKAAAAKDGKQPQPAAGNASPFSFKANPDAPIDIEATTLDVDDRAKKAIYKGNVIAKQGEFVVHTALMTAYYTGQTGLAAGAGTAPQAKGAKGDPAQATQLTKVEARQQVTVIGKDGQQAIGEWADFDVKANIVTLGGGVTVSQQKNVINCPKGAKFQMNMTTGVSTCEGATEADAPVAKAVPALSSASPSDANAAPPVPKPKERLKLVIYPNAAKDAAKKATGSKDAETKSAPTAGSAWESTTKSGSEKR